MRLVISCELSARQRIFMKYQNNLKEEILCKYKTKQEIENSGIVLIKPVHEEQLNHCNIPQKGILLNIRNKQTNFKENRRLGLIRSVYEG